MRFSSNQLGNENFEIGLRCVPPLNGYTLICCNPEIVTQPGGQITEYRRFYVDLWLHCLLQFICWANLSERSGTFRCQLRDGWEIGDWIAGSCSILYILLLRHIRKFTGDLPDEIFRDRSIHRSYPSTWDTPSLPFSHKTSPATTTFYRDIPRAAPGGRSS